MNDKGDPAEEAHEKILGRHVRALRVQHGWSQETLSEKSGVSEATIRAIESNYPHHRQRRHGTLIALSRALDLPSDYLIDYLDNPLPEGRLIQPVATEPVQQPSTIDQILQRLDRIDAMLSRLMEVFYPSTPGSRIDVGHSSEDSKQ